MTLQRQKTKLLEDSSLLDLANLGFFTGGLGGRAKVELGIRRIIERVETEI